ncbi:MAG: T9SS type A sorting domain-containing protein [candidate division WOR-3 bacterium]
MLCFGMLALLQISDALFIRDCCEPTGYYQWLFGWIGPWEGNGCTGAGPNLRGYMYWPIPSSVANMNITGVSLRLVTNNSGSTSLNVNKVGAYQPSAQDCGDGPYTSGFAVPSGADVEFYVPLGGSIISDLKAKAGGMFGLGLSGTGADKFFYSHWAYYPDDAWLVINYNPLYEDVGEGTVITDVPGRAFLYDITGRCVKDMGVLEPGAHDLSGLALERGVYILMIGEKVFKIIRR